MPDVDTTKSFSHAKLNCEFCKKEIPRSAAQTVEGDDYVLYFCGVQCYEAWRRSAHQAKAPKK